MPRAKKRRRNLLLQLLLVVVLLAAVGFSFGLNVLAPQKQMGVPEQLGDLQLVSIVEGSQAIEQISRLHGTDIKLVAAYIARYAGGNGRATVWASRTESTDAAAELTRRMIEAIGKGDSVFVNLQRLTIAGHEVFRVDGPGGEHFFYSSGEQRERVVWLTIEAADALVILEQALKDF